MPAPGEESCNSFISRASRWLVLAAYFRRTCRAVSRKAVFFLVEVAGQCRVPAGIDGILSNISQAEPLGMNMVLSIIFLLPVPQPPVMGADIADSHQQRHQRRKKGFIRKAEQLGNRLLQLEGKVVLVQIMQVAKVENWTNTHTDKSSTCTTTLSSQKWKTNPSCFDHSLPGIASEVGLLSVVVFFGKIDLQFLRIADSRDISLSSKGELMI